MEQVQSTQVLKVDPFTSLRTLSEFSLKIKKVTLSRSLQHVIWYSFGEILKKRVLGKFENMDLGPNMHLLPFFGHGDSFPKKSKTITA